MSLNIGINYAQKLGRELNVPVIPVNHLEGHVLTPRFSQIDNLTQEVPKQLFPFMTLLVTGKHSELILSRGVGLHTILGISIDCGIGDCLDKAYGGFKKYLNVLRDEANIRGFVERYNYSHAEKIPEGYFDFLKIDNISRGHFIELLARYGDPTDLELPLGFNNHPNCDMTFTGMKTAIQSCVS